MNKLYIDIRSFLFCFYFYTRVAAAVCFFNVLFTLSSVLFVTVNVYERTLDVASFSSSSETKDWRLFELFKFLLTVFVVFCCCLNALTHWQCVGELSWILCVCFYCGLFVFCFVLFTLSLYITTFIRFCWFSDYYECLCVDVFVWAGMNASVWVCFDRCNEEIEQVKWKLSRIALTKHLITKQWSINFQLINFIRASHVFWVRLKLKRRYLSDVYLFHFFIACVFVLFGFCCCLSCFSIDILWKNLSCPELLFPSLLPVLFCWELFWVCMCVFGSECEYVLWISIGSFFQLKPTLIQNEKRYEMSLAVVSR